MSKTMLCIMIEQHAHTEGVRVTSIDTCETSCEVEFRIIQCEPAMPRRKTTYHIHFTSPLVPTHDCALQEEAARFGLDPELLREIFTLALARTAGSTRGVARSADRKMAPKH